MITLNPPNGRGCGSRKSGGTYLCTGQSMFGMPIEDFIIDPAKPWNYEIGQGFVLLKSSLGHYNVGIFVGKESYPSPWDFVEESRRFGVS